jgi:hypothetical protein
MTKPPVALWGLCPQGETQVQEATCARGPPQSATRGKSRSERQIEVRATVEVSYTLTQ